MRLRPDLLFLDIAMPGMSGIEVLSRIATSVPESFRPWVVFTTAHEDHAVEAFALEALDYLVKPVEPEALERALRRARKRLWERSSQPGAPDVARPVEPNSAEPNSAEPSSVEPSSAEDDPDTERGGADPAPTHLLAHVGSKELRVPVVEIGVLEVLG